MYKLKTSKSIKKRIKYTSNGKLMRHCSTRSHLLQKKTSKRKRRLRKISFINLSDKLNLKNSLPYI
uniref:Large ribosomal subunit protein bL35c n=1 Tax=Dipterocladia arabiensis TaxID=2007176 RepID=A0A1Z1M0J7_9FLOR|nr:ribosomal protein L35 [Dipterocladia arabiensis]ARW59401.1 ribosomal protein L35 [Dipterocladia arabiensis]